MSEELRRARRIAFAAAFAALLAIASYVSFGLPLTDVPFTLQTLVVMLAGAVLGPGLGALSVVVYLLLGAMGVPVFASGSSGLGVLFGPLGGYLISWPIAAAIAGVLAQRGYFLRVVGMVLALAVIYAFGIAGLHLSQGTGWTAAFWAGAAPFFPLDLIKLLIAAAIAPPLRRLVVRQAH